MVIRNKHILILGWTPFVLAALWFLRVAWRVVPYIMEGLGIALGFVGMILLLLFMIFFTGEISKTKGYNGEAVTLFVKKDKNSNEVSP